MKATICSLFFLAFFAFCERISADEIIPAPVSQTQRAGADFVLPSSVSIGHDAASLKTARWLKTLFEAAGASVQLLSESSVGNTDVWVGESADLLPNGEEAYSIQITSSGIVLKGASASGSFYSVQALRQLLPSALEDGSFSGELRLSPVDILSYPAYSWRGSMLDVARHFFSLEILKNHVDRMALYHMNRLHLHLSDDQGWRVESKKYPLLHQVGGSTQVGAGAGGFYTQAEIQDLVSYAAARHVTIVPEFDMPGHVQAMLASYPRLACSGASTSLYTGTDVGFSKLCLSDPSIYGFVDTVLSEIAALFPSPWLHMGGDEISDPLYASFVTHSDSVIRSLGKIPVGWEEILSGVSDAPTLVQNWKVPDVVSATVASRGMGLILSPCDVVYFDHANEAGQPNTNNWCQFEDGAVDLKESYNWFPETRSAAVGIEAPVWTEHVTTVAELDNRFWPRLIAVAELSWSPAAKRSWSDFVLRLSLHGERLDRMGIAFYLSPEVTWKRADSPASFARSVFMNMPSETPVASFPQRRVFRKARSSKKTNFDLLGRERLDPPAGIFFPY